MDKGVGGVRYYQGVVLPNLEAAACPESENPPAPAMVALIGTASRPARVGVAGGARKFEAIRGAMRGKWIDVLITDLGTAQRLAEG